MSPFYRKEGENWVLLKYPTDIHIGEHRGNKAEILPVERDSEQIGVAVTGDLII